MSVVSDERPTAGPVVAGTAALRSFPDGGTAVVIGSSGGIGHALADAIDATDRFGRLHRLSRSSAPPLDLVDETTIAAAAEAIAAEGAPLRLVLVASGFLHGDGITPEKSLAGLGPAGLARAFAVNATGPALVLKHFAPLLPREERAVIAVLSAKVGSIGDNQLGGWYAYRASKAALNQLVHTAAIEIGRRRKAAVLAALHPGTVDTDLSAPFARSGLAVRPPGEAAERILRVVDGLRPEHTGGFFSHDGTALPW